MENLKKILKSILISLVTTILLFIISNFKNEEFATPLNISIFIFFFVVMSYGFYKQDTIMNNKQQKIFAISTSFISTVFLSYLISNHFQRNINNLPELGIVTIYFIIMSIFFYKSLKKRQKRLAH